MRCQRDVSVLNGLTLSISNDPGDGCRWIDAPDGKGVYITKAPKIEPLVREVM